VSRDSCNTLLEEDYSWSPLFQGLPTPSEPQTYRGTTTPGRNVEDLSATPWRILEFRPDGLVLRDGVEARWSEETLWCPGRTPGCSYAIRWKGQEYEFRAQLATWNPYAHDPKKAKVRRRPEAA